jgi:hypothetical protein
LQAIRHISKDTVIFTIIPITKFKPASKSNTPYKPPTADAISILGLLTLLFKSIRVIKREIKSILKFTAKSISA